MSAALAVSLYALGCFVMWELLCAEEELAPSNTPDVLLWGVVVAWPLFALVALMRRGDG